jgi:hypothetical protein
MGFVSLVAPLQPLRGTLGELRCQVRGEELSFLHFAKILDHIEPSLFETLIVFKN